MSPFLTMRFSFYKCYFSVCRLMVLCLHVVLIITILQFVHSSSELNFRDDLYFF